MYFTYHDGGAVYTSGDERFEPGRQYNRRGVPRAGNQVPVGEDGIQAFDPETGKTVWRFRLTQGGLSPGVLATGGGVVFAATSEGNFLALDAKTGKELWHFTTGSPINSSPISYAVDGKQYVAVTSAGVLYSFGLPE
jgi:alcohol dehydrogenase (cytochrome c)